MSGVNESSSSCWAWLAYLPFFPLPGTGILVASAAALIPILGSLR